MAASTTTAFTRLLRNLCRDERFGRRAVPIVPDEARTFGMDALFRELKIYAPHGQLYDPVDAHMLLSYVESDDGQIIEEASPRQAHWRRSSLPARRTPPTVCRWSRSSPTTPCSDSNESWISSGRSHSDHLNHRIEEWDTALLLDDSYLASRFEKIERSDNRNDAAVVSLLIIITAVLLAAGLATWLVVAWLGGAAAYLATFLVDARHRSRSSEASRATNVVAGFPCRSRRLERSVRTRAHPARS